MWEVFNIYKKHGKYTIMRSTVKWNNVHDKTMLQVLCIIAQLMDIHIWCIQHITEVIAYTTLCHKMIAFFEHFEHNIQFKVNDLAGFEHLWLISFCTLFSFHLQFELYTHFNNSILKWLHNITEFVRIPIRGSREDVIWIFSNIIQCKIVTPGAE